MYSTVCTTLVSYWLLRYIAVPIAWILFKFCYKIPNDKVYLNKIQEAGEWAVVTGATDGIGREYCNEFGKLGKNLFLLSRNEDKLKDLQETLQSTYHVSVEYLKVDFTDVEIYDEISSKLSELNVGILINNVGMTQSYPCYFDELAESPNFFESLLNCNILSYVKMTHILLPKMKVNNCGIIINITSASTLQYTPLSILYSSSKCFLYQFSKSLQLECANTNLIIQTVLPFFVQTKFIGKFKPPRFLTPNAQEYVEQAVQTIGEYNETYGTISHSIQGAIINSMPRFITSFFSLLLNKQRAKVLKAEQ